MIAVRLTPSGTATIYSNSQDRIGQTGQRAALLPRPPAHISKSIHMTFVHSCSALGVFLISYLLDRGSDFWVLIELGEMVSPGAIRLHVPFDVLHQITQAFPCVVPCALVIDIAERSLNGIGPWTIRWQP